MIELSTVLAGLKREHVFRGLADHAEGIDSDQNPHPGRRLDHHTIIGGESYGARTLVVYAAKYGPHRLPVGKLVIDGSDGVSDRLCRERLEELGFKFDVRPN